MGSTTYTTAQRAAFRVVVADQITTPSSVDELKVTDTTSVKWNTTAPPAITADVKDASPTGKFLRDDGTWQTVTGDPWIYAKLASDFTTTSNSVVDVTGLSFTPAANKIYEFAGILMLRTAIATVNPIVGLAWPTGMGDGVASIDESQTATGGYIYAVGNVSAAILTTIGSLPNTTGSWPTFITGMVVAGASPSGTVKVQLQSESAGTTVTVKTGSFLKWREI